MLLMSDLKRKQQRLKVFTWDELSAYILKETPFPPRIFPTLKTQLDAGALVPLNFLPAVAETPKDQAS
jgi:hypothetical protein